MGFRLGRRREDGLIFTILAELSIQPFRPLFDLSLFASLTSPDQKLPLPAATVLGTMPFVDWLVGVDIKSVLAFYITRRTLNEPGDS
jgi:hypothetical protein